VHEELALTVRYRVDGGPLPAVVSPEKAIADVQAAAGAQESTNLRVDPDNYARVRLGDAFALRVLRLHDEVALVRPANRSTRSEVPWDTLTPWLVIAACAVVAWGLRKTRLGAGPLRLIALVALAYPLVHSYQVWRERDDLSRASQHATATVVATTRITGITLGGFRGRGYTHFDVAQPYDVVQVEFLPPGFPEKILTADAVDARPDGGGGSGLQPGDAVDVLYAPDDPYGARLTGHTRTHHWQTTRGAYQSRLMMLGLSVVLILLLTTFLPRLAARVLSVGLRRRGQARRLPAVPAAPEAPDPSSG
jgi:hypothetical protein